MEHDHRLDAAMKEQNVLLDNQNNTLKKQNELLKELLQLIIQGNSIAQAQLEKLSAMSEK